MRNWLAPATSWATAFALLACSGDDVVQSQKNSTSVGSTGSAQQTTTSAATSSASTGAGGSSSASTTTTSGPATGPSTTSGPATTTSATGGAGPGSSTGGAAGSSATTTTGGGGGAGGKGGSGGAGGSGGVAKDAGVIDASVETGPPPPPPDPGPLSGGGAGCNDKDPVHQGSATFYNVGPTSPVNCGYDLSMLPQPASASSAQPPYYWVAINGDRYAGSKACGACIQATGPTTKKTFLVVDSCKIENNNPLCTTEHLDLSSEGFQALGGNGRIDSMPWQYVPCDSKGDVAVFTQANSNTFFSTIGIRNHRYRIDKVELVTGTTRLALMRRDDNFFVIDSTTPVGAAGMALGPFRLRITDIYGHWIENKITLNKGQNVGMTLQFPACPAGGDAGT